MTEPTTSSTDPTHFPRRILLAVTGLSPQIVTETLYGLTIASDQPFVPTEIHLISTEQGANRAELMLLDPVDGRFGQFCAEFGIPADRIKFDVEQIHIVPGHDGTPLTDITGEIDNIAAADTITDYVRAFTADPETAVHASIAGGRKTMGFFLGYAMSLYGRPQDRLSHVLVSAPFEQDHQFYYPPAEPKRLIIRDQPVHTSTARIMLADIPFVRLRDGLPKQLHEGKTSYSGTIAAAQRALEPPRLLLDLDACAILASGTRVDLTPASMATLALFARRAVAGQPPLPAPNKHVPEHAWAERFLAEYRQIKGYIDEDDETLVALKRGMDGDYFSGRLHHLHRELDDALGPIARHYRIDNGGTRPGRFSLQLEEEQVRFENLDEERKSKV